MSWASWIIRNEAVGTVDAKMAQYNGFARELGIVNGSRKQELVTLRWLFWEEMMKDRDIEITFSATGRVTGHDHATVMNAMRKLQEYREAKDKIIEHEQRRFEQLKSSYYKGLVIEE